MTTPEELLVANLPLVERITRHVAMRQRFSSDETEEILGETRLRLVENDYAILQKFEGKSSLATYLTVVITRICLDHRVQQWGKWRSSADAKRLGEHAVELEQLISRDDLSPADAAARMIERHPSLQREELERLVEALPTRWRRPRATSDDTLRNISGSAATDADVLSAESRQDALRASTLLQETMSSLPPKDRLILRFRFQDAMKIADIAPMVGIEVKQLYRHIDRLMTRLRQELLASGLTAAAVRSVLAEGVELPELSLFAAAGEKSRPGPSHREKLNEMDAT